MSAIEKIYKSARRRLSILQADAREEAWKTAYLEAERCHFFELEIASFVESLDYLKELNRSWRMAVYRAIEEPDDELNQLIKGCFVEWLEAARQMENSLLMFESLGYGIERATEFREGCTAVGAMTANWVSPSPAKSPSMRQEEISPEEAEALRSILERSPGMLRVNPLPLPEGNASCLR